MKLTVAILACLLLVGCQPRGIADQRWLAKPNMQFSTSGIFSDSKGLYQQVEPGSAIGPGAQGAGCTSCK